MSPLSPISDADWSTEIAEAAKEFFNATIDVLEPAGVGAFDPVADEQVRDALIPVITGRAARVQHFGSGSDHSGSAQWEIGQPYRFQIELLADDPVLRKGMTVRVTNAGGKNPVLERLAYQVRTVANSSHAAIRTIETVSEGEWVDG